jgi:SAM-dependent methyltransferase
MPVTAPGTPSSAKWGSRSVRRSYGRSGYLEDGERAAFASVGDAALDGARILDLAVGGGRTTSFLAPVAGTYLGVDISPEMLRMALGRYPGVAFAQGDLADLSGFADASWDVIDVSFNSIDVLDHEQRRRSLRDLHRMLVPGGHLVISSLLLHPGPVDAPSLSELAPALTRHGWRHPRMRAAQTRDTLLGLWHFRRNRSQIAEGDGWAWRPLRGHEFRFVTYFSTLPHAIAGFREAGFDVIGAWSETGLPLRLERRASPRGVGHAHFHCRRPAEDAA